MPAARVYTVGHGTAEAAEFTALLSGAGIEQVIDVRRFPGSRKHPHMGRDRLAEWLPDAGIGYRWEERLGGRRHLRAGDPREDPWWRVEAFAAYAAHTRTTEFAGGLRDLMNAAEESVTAIMCSESVWWRCHRRVVADVLVLGNGVPVTHVMPGGRLTEHRVAEGARVHAGAVYWDGPT